ncbi:podocalyxin isoform X2 [Apus apus]|uniref:podocalyxin isoform X2 n=1 Tax=Apus apus TaxID=8895 RepID=UPI0021F8C8DA|nr:podocalyxin isoform X2 [Apus apus]
MRAPLLLLLPLLLIGVSSQDVTTSASPGENKQDLTTGTSTVQGDNPTSKPGNTPTTPVTSPVVLQRSNPTSKPGNTPTTSAVSLTSVQGTTPTSKPGNSPSTSATLTTAVQGTTSTNNPKTPSPAPTTSPNLPQQVNSSPGSGSSTAAPAAATTATQQTNPPANSGSSAATTAANPVPAHASNLTTTPGGSGTTVTSSPSTKSQGSQLSDQLASTAVSTTVPVSLAPGLKDHGDSSPTSVPKQPHSSSSSPDQELATSTRPESTNISVTPFDRPISPTTLQPGDKKVSEAATTSTLGADQRSQDTRSVPTKPSSADQSPASTQPSAPAPGDQTASSSPGCQHPNTSFQNKIICEDQMQNNWPTTIYLKEARNCAEWRMVSTNISFFESFCSTGQHVFNASRETCTVVLTSREPRSQHWAVQAVVHLPLDTEKVLEELKEKKDKLEELGIANITYDKMEREMVITDEFSTPLIITIITLAGSLLLIAAIYGCCHQRFSQKKDQHIHPDLPGFDDGHVALIFNRLTEELQTMENGYHDNPTLEVMETSSEMQEKKVNLNGELGDSWIVPLDTLMKEDLEEEEDTHL